MPSRVATKVKAEATVAGDDGIDPAFHRAILKIALELKKPNAPSYDSIVRIPVFVATRLAMRLAPPPAA